MLNEELYIITDEGRMQLDLPSPSGITLKWVSNLFNDISKLTCSYSYTFKLPMTANNRRALSIADDVRRDVAFAKKSVSAEFYINGVCLCPNANLYISEISSSFQCVMTWRVLKAFETLKSASDSLTDLPSLGKIEWGNGETYGGSDDSTSNMDAVVYPDYDAGVPHEEATPPKPCVPVYRLIKMINETYGVDFNVGTLISKGMGLLSKNRMNNKNYYGKRVYDDYISYGVVPLTNSELSDEKYTISDIHGLGSYTHKVTTLEYTQTWSVLLVKSNVAGSYVLHYGITEGTYTGLQQVNSEQIVAEYQEPTTYAVGMAVFDDFKGNDFIKPAYGYQHDTGLSFFNKHKGERSSADYILANASKTPTWGTRVYTGTEQVSLEISTDKSTLEGLRTVATLTSDTTGNFVVEPGGGDAGSILGVVGIYSRVAFVLRGSCEVHISKAAVTAGRVDVSTYMWMCLAKMSSDEDEPEAVSGTDISKESGFQSLDVPTLDTTTNTYVCHFDFGQQYEARKIDVDAEDDEDFQAFVFLPYIPDEHKIEVTIPAEDEDSEDTTEERLNLQEGDIYFENFVLSSVKPSVEVSTLPATLQVTSCLPDIKCFDFMKSVFYMNGAMPRVERDGKTISAMYYNMLRDNVNDGNTIDWSDKLMSSESDLPDSINFHNTSFAKVNYFVMASSYVDTTSEELAEELDVYSDGYGSLNIDDDTLDDDSTIFTASFYPAYIQNMRYPLVKTGKTCKVWEGDKTISSEVKPIYGIMVYRCLDPDIEDANATRPNTSSVSDYSKRMDVFSPFDDESMMEKLFGYYQAILDDYCLIKEKFLLNEIDLRDFNESVPIYLSKYNAYFAVSTIQRSKDGVSTVELIKLPRVNVDSEVVSTGYEVEILSVASITMATTGSKDIYYKSEKDDAWHVDSGNHIWDLPCRNVAAFCGEEVPEGTISLILGVKAQGKYKYTYTDDYGNKKSIIRYEANVYFDGADWSANTYDNDKHYINDKKDWHKIDVIIPIRDQYGDIIETRTWTSPLLVGDRELTNYSADDVRVDVEIESAITTLTLGLVRNYTSNACPIVYEGGQTTYNTLIIGKDNVCPEYAYPYEASYIKGDSYTLSYTVASEVTCTVTKRKGYENLGSQTYKATLRTYYDDTRVAAGSTLTIAKSEFGGYHTFKFIADITDEDGNIVKKLRYRLIWFVSALDKSVLETDFGDEHDEDASAT